MGSDLYHWELTSWDHDDEKIRREAFEAGFREGIDRAIREVLEERTVGPVSVALVERLERLRKRPPKEGKK